MCTLGGAECGTYLFQDRDSWFHHELAKHRSQYACILCKFSASSSTDLKDHFLKVHGNFSDSQLSTLEELGMEFPTQFKARDCPFCDEWAESLLQKSTPGGQVSGLIQDILVNESQFKKHVASHQEQLATLAISQANGGESTPDANSAIYSGATTMPLAMDIDESHDEDVEMESNFSNFSQDTSNILANASASRSTISKDSTLDKTRDDTFMGFEEFEGFDIDKMGEATDTIDNFSTTPMRSPSSNTSVAKDNKVLPTKDEQSRELKQNYMRTTVHTWTCVCVIANPQKH